MGRTRWEGGEDWWGEEMDKRRGGSGGGEKLEKEKVDTEIYCVWCWSFLHTLGLSGGTLLPIVG